MSFIPISIPKVPNLAATVIKLIKAYDSAAEMKQFVSKIMDSLADAEAIHDQLKSFNLDNAKKACESAFNAMKNYSAGLKSACQGMSMISDTASALAEISEGVLKTPFENINSISDALAGIADISSDGTGMLADVRDMLSDLSDISADSGSSLVSKILDSSDVLNDFAKKDMFSDLSGLVSEAAAQANFEKASQGEEVLRLGNGPCGNKTKDLGGVNHNEAEGSEEDAQEKSIHLANLATAVEEGDLSDIEQECYALVDKMGEPKSLVAPYIKDARSTIPQTKAALERYRELYAKYVSSSILGDLAAALTSNVTDNKVNKSNTVVGMVASGYEQSTNFFKKMFTNDDDAEILHAVNKAVTTAENDTAVNEYTMAMNYNMDGNLQVV